MDKQIKARLTDGFYKISCRTCIYENALPRNWCDLNQWNKLIEKARIKDCSVAFLCPKYTEKEDG